MSITLIKPYFRSGLNSLGLYEWTDGFPSDNIPSTLVEESYQHNIEEISGSQLGALDHGFNVSYTVDVFFNGYRDVKTNIDRAVSRGEDIVVQLCNPANYGSDVQRVELASMRPVPLDEDLNDNVIKLEMRFEVRVSVCF
jgi:hypothetical protein